jgi:hypothetical protein
MSEEEEVEVAVALEMEMAEISREEVKSPAFYLRLVTLLR